MQARTTPQSAFGFRFVTPFALGSALNPVNSTMISTALVPIAQDLHVGVADAGWLISGLYLASAVAQPTMGRLADLFGPRRVYLMSLSLIALAGVLGQFAPSLITLVMVRVLLGIGTSGAYPSAMRLFRVQAERSGCEPPRVAMGVLSMLARNRPLVTTYLRAGTMLMMVYCMLYGFAQWLETSAGYSGATAGLVTIPMSIMAAASSLIGTRTRSIRTPFLISIGSALLGCAALLMVDSYTPVWGIALAALFFGAPQGMFSTATQAAIYVQAPPEEIGTAAGLQRTAQYVGAIAATSVLALMFGPHATDHGLHSLAWIMAALSMILFVSTVFDRTLGNRDTRA